MESSPPVVIKVKYGDMLRRFNAVIAKDELILTMDVLRRKILSLFSLAPDTEMMLTYVDEDNDLVNLVNDDDIRDVVSQVLNPLRITVAVNAEKSGKQRTHSSASSTPLRTPQVQPMQNLQTDVSEILGTFPEPVREALVKLSTDLASKASSSTPGISELLGSFTKMGLSYLDQLLESQTRVQSSSQDSVPGSTAAMEGNDLELSRVPAATSGIPSNEGSGLPYKNNESLEKLEPQVVSKGNEVKIPTVAGGSMGGSTFDFTAVAAALDSLNMNATIPNNDSLPNPVPLHPKSGIVSCGRKKEVKKISETTPLPRVADKSGKTSESCNTSSNWPSIVDIIATKGVVDRPTKLKVRSIHVNAGDSDPKSGKHIDVAGKSELPDGLAKSSGVIWLPSHLTKCPSGIVVGNASDFPPNPTSKAISSRSPGQNVGSQKHVHHGVCCDGCDIHPIRGPRFKSKVKVDYDLCSTCFEKMGNDKDYIRMDFPVVYRSHVPFRGSTHHAQARGRGSILPHAYSDCMIKPVAIKLDSCFVEDVNMFDGTVMESSTPFTKVWRMRNNGTVGWLQGTQLVWIGGDKMSNVLSVELKIPAGGVWMDQELDVMVDFISPELPGRYISYWRMATPTGEKFGQRVWVLIQVEPSTRETLHEKIRYLNLNLPPESCSLTGPEFIKVDPEPVVVGNHPEPDNSIKRVELMQPETEQDLKFPINNNLLVGGGALNPAPSSASLSVPRPITDFSGVPLPPTSVPLMPFPLPSQKMQPEASVASASYSAAEDFPEKNQVEEKLLRELEDMGFKQIDLNKEILRINEYNLEQAVDDLCGDSEWDSILDELEEMDFCNREMNKILLKKHNGSFKHVVMDLITGETGS